MEIRLEGLTKIFTDKTGKQTRAVDELTVTIPSGKLVGLLGPSGCGKSTTLFMIAGLHQPTGGKIYFGEDDVTRLAPEKRGIGLVFQNYALYPHMTIRQNIMFPLENLNIKKQEADELVVEMAKLVGIEDQLDKKPAQLSGGQQQRVAIARALVKKPRVLLLDEPLSNLDARLRLQTREEIKRIQKETGITTIFVTHDQDEAMSISDEIILMNFGEEQQKGAPQEVYDNPNNLFVAKFLGTPPIGLYQGQINNEELLIDDKVILKSEKIAKEKSREVIIGVRPEAYSFSSNGVIEIENTYVETIGRDLSIVANHVKAITKPFRVVISSNEYDKVKTGTVKFALHEKKVFVFDKEDGRRLL